MSIETVSEECPEPRAGHSAILFEDKMYVYGGKNEENNKLNDFWSFDLTTFEWQRLADADNVGLSRSGHSVCVYENHMIVFGGIHEITKELDDMFAYSFRDQKWVSLYKLHEE
jgi:N-acetylneuraminic acid mutarotase